MSGRPAHIGIIFGDDPKGEDLYWEFKQALYPAERHKTLVNMVQQRQKIADFTHMLINDPAIDHFDIDSQAHEADTKIILYRHNPFLGQNIYNGIIRVSASMCYTQATEFDDLLKLIRRGF